ncbi:MAG: hypothetical protein IKB72_05645 [Ruminococcus sp.]|nr:hypothetical protein [Ruminococcus sp.]
MNKDEMKNRISLALTDPILQQGFEIICKENAEENCINKTCVVKLLELEAENACECRRCVYSDSPCILSDYGKDKNGICDHFKDVFDENAELKEELKQAEKAKVVERFEAYGQCRDSRRIAELEAQIEKMKCCGNCKHCGEVRTYKGLDGKNIVVNCNSGRNYFCDKWEIK